MLVLLWLCSVLAGMSPPEAIDTLCASFSNAHQCNKAIEERQLPVWGDRVSRAGTTLNVTLRSGDIVRLEDCLYHYRFRECSQGAAKCVFVKGGNEHISYVVVDVVTGRQDEYLGLPTFSPDGASVIVAGLGGVYGGTRFLEVRDVAADEVHFRLTHEDLERMAKEIPTCAPPPIELVSPGAGQARWKTNETAHFNFWCFDGSQNLRSTSYALSRNEHGWAMAKGE